MSHVNAILTIDLHYTVVSLQEGEKGGAAWGDHCEAVKPDKHLSSCNYFLRRFFHLMLMFHFIDPTGESVVWAVAHG